MERKQIYNLNEALQRILEPTSDSELSDMSEDEDPVDISLSSMPPRVGAVPEAEISDEEEDEEVNEKEYENEESGEKMGMAVDKANEVIDGEIDIEQVVDSSGNDEKIDLSKFETTIPRWRSKAPPAPNTEFSGKEFRPPPEDFDTWTPLNYFELFWKEDLNVLLSEQTNLYSVQRKGTSINSTSGEIRQLIGLQMFMSIFNLPTYRMYWAKETRYPPIADVMSVNRYKLLRENLHVSDNLQRDDPENAGNKLYKIQPVLDHVRNNCTEIEPEIEHSIDEQIIPAKTTYSGIRQYNPKKPVKWGFKNFVRAGSSGIMYDFFLYTGKVKNQKVTGPYVVLRLLETLPRRQNFKVFYDNWFSSYPLCLALKENGYLATATLRADRTKNCPLPVEKDLKKQGRGTHSYRTDANSGLTITKWFDNKCVQLISNHCDPESTSRVKRWDRENKKYIEISCPSVVQEYNKSMGRVDLADMLISSGQKSKQNDGI